MTRARRAAAVFFLLAFVGLIWPVYSLFGNERPILLGMPQSLFYVAVWLVASFLVLLALYLHEERD